MRSSLSSAAALVLVALAPLPLRGAAQDPVVSHSISISTREATLELELASGTVRSLSLRGGRVFVDDRQAGDYTPGGQLDRDWRRLLNDGANLDTPALLAALRSWRAPTLAAAERSAKARLESALASLSAGKPIVAVSRPVQLAPVPADTAAAPASVPETVFVQAPAPAEPVAEAVARPRQAVERVFGDVVTVVAWFLACAMLGFGAVFFGRHQLEVVADTARQSFGRSFVTGLLGQLMLVPTFAALIVGLTLTIVGILVVPIAVFAYLVAAAAALAGGYLAVAHAIGETYTRRRMAHGAFVSAPNAYGYLFTGLIGLLGLWAAAALTGWMGPVVVIFRVLASMVTWLAVTTGFGAVLLSRAGLRQTFAGGRMGEATDEYLWATPPATPTAAKMKEER